MKLVSWYVIGGLLVVLIGLYAWLFWWTRKRQKKFESQYNAAKERREVFVLHKRVVRERPKTGWFRYIPVKTYQIVGRVNLSQAVRGIHMSKMQTITFHTTKDQYDKVQPNHRYKMDVAGNYIGYVVAPPVLRTREPGAWKKWFRRGGRGQGGQSKRAGVGASGRPTPAATAKGNSSGSKGKDRTKR